MQYQLITATKESPHIIAPFPMFYGAYCPHAFWNAIIPSSKTRPAQEQIWVSCWNAQTNDWGTPKIKSLPFSIVALLLLNVNPTDMQFGLPHFACLQRPTNKDQVPDYLLQLKFFGIKYTNYLSNHQKFRLMEHILSVAHSSCETYQALNDIWHYQRQAIQPPPFVPTGDNE